MKEKARFARLVRIIVVLVILASLCLAVNVSPVSAQLATPPQVTTSRATFVETNTANLNGYLRDLGTASSVAVSFEYGITPAYGSETMPQTMYTSGSFATGIGGLIPGTTYHYRAKAVGDLEAYGSDMTFTTEGESQPEVAFSSATYGVAEGDGSATITLTLSAASLDTVMVDFDTNDGSAVAPDDYAAASGTLTFAPGSTGETFHVAIVDHSLYEMDETVNLTLSNPVNTTLGTPSTAVLTIFDDDPSPEVEIDIKPGSFPNSINPKSKGVIPVAILTTAEFDASTVDVETVRFGPAEIEAVHYALEDVDNDGDIDMILHFKIRDSGIQAGDTEAELTGQTIEGRNIHATDSVRTVPRS